MRMYKLSLNICMIALASLAGVFNVSATPQSAAEGDAGQVKLTLHRLSLKPESRTGWDEDNSLPDLRVKIKAAGSAKGEWALVLPAIKDSAELVWNPPIEVIIPAAPRSLTVYVEDKDDAQYQKVSAFRVKWSADDVRDSKVRTFRSKTVAQFEVTLSHFEPSPLPSKERTSGQEHTTEVASAAEVSPATPVATKDPLEGYQPSLSAPVVSLKPYDLSGDMLTESGFNAAASALYNRYVQLKANGQEIEAKEVLVQLIHLHPKTHYATRAKRVLF